MITTIYDQDRYHGKRPLGNAVFNQNGNELTHYGTKNMKWGVRHYQNEDGTLTEEGKIRYGTDDPSKAKEKIQRMHDIENETPSNRTVSEALMYNNWKKYTGYKDAADKKKERETNTVSALNEASSLAGKLVSANNALYNLKESSQKNKDYKENLSRMKDTKNMSDDELRSATQRLQMENAYKQAALNGAQQSTGRDKVNNLLTIAGSVAAAGATAAGLYLTIKKLTD